MSIKKHQAWANEEKGLTYGGKKPKIPGVGDHELKQLADAAGVQLSSRGQAMLERMSAFVKFAGRYPIPTTPEQMKPTQNAKGQKVAPTFFSSREFELAINLAKRLMDEVLPYKK